MSIFEQIVRSKMEHQFRHSVAGCDLRLTLRTPIALQLRDQLVSSQSRSVMHLGLSATVELVTGMVPHFDDSATHDICITDDRGRSTYAVLEETSK